MDSCVCDVYGMKTDKHFINISNDNICSWDAINMLISDDVQVENSG